MIDLDKLLAQIPRIVIHELLDKLQENLDKCGLYYRTFSRIKSPTSTKEKLILKGYSDKKRMQDLLGIRIALYFKDDIPICRKIIENTFTVDHVTQDEEKIDTFSPTRLNYVCKIPSEIVNYIPSSLFEEFPIDNTFEIQIRTIFSEGWHEIEHDLRYKSKSDWEGNNDLSRALNGIFATLETCDWSIINVFEELSYRKYKQKDWAAMLKNKLRIHLLDDKVDERIIFLLSKDLTLAKEFLRVDRFQLLIVLSDRRIINFPKTLNNVIFAINEIFIKNPELHVLAPKKLCEQINLVANDISPHL